ncbi:four helix bundle protein [Elusimicrobiota bacterium]
MAKTFRDLIVWQESKKLTKHIYEITAAFPKEEIYGLTSQMRKASVSMAANIAEGWGNNASKRQFTQYLNMANGSLTELECHIEISHELGFITEPIKQSSLAHSRRISYLINRFRDKLK